VKNAAKAVKVTGEQTESMFLRAALLDSGGVQLLGLIEAVAFGVNLDDLCPMDETVDESDHAGGVREDSPHSDNALLVLRSSGRWAS
jgi:hypothetical protein